MFDMYKIRSMLPSLSFFLVSSTLFFVWWNSPKLSAVTKPCIALIFHPDIMWLLFFSYEHPIHSPSISHHAYPIHSPSSWSRFPYIPSGCISMLCYSSTIRYRSPYTPKARRISCEIWGKSVFKTTCGSTGGGGGSSGGGSSGGLGELKVKAGFYHGKIVWLICYLMGVNVILMGFNGI